MIFIFSMYIPDTWKCQSWLLWDRRETWRVCKAYHRDFQLAYEVLRLHEHIDALLKEHMRESA